MTTRKDQDQASSRRYAMMGGPVVNAALGLGKDNFQNRAPQGLTKPGDKITWVAADHNNAFGGLMGGTPAIKVEHDGTGPGMKAAVDAKLDKMGIKPETFHPQLEMTAGQARGKFNGQKFDGYVLKGHHPQHMNNASAKGTTFAGAGGMNAAGTNFKDAAFAGPIEGAWLRGAQLTGIKQVGAVNANRIQAPNATITGKAFAHMTDANLSGSTLDLDMSGVNAARANFAHTNGRVNATYARMERSDWSHSNVGLDAAGADVRDARADHAPAILVRNPGFLNQRTDVATKAPGADAEFNLATARPHDMMMRARKREEFPVPAMAA